MWRIGGKIPPELYQAVAEVLAYVYGLKEKIKTYVDEIKTVVTDNVNMMRRSEMA